MALRHIENMATLLCKDDSFSTLLEDERACKNADIARTRRTIHRADLQNILVDSARESGVNIRTDCEVVSVDCKAGSVRLVSGEVASGDLVIAADGLWSALRNTIIDDKVEPTETGDLAYRGTFTREQLEALGDDDVKAFCKTQQLNMWLGPLNHAVFYPIRGGSLYNLVLLKPDDMESGQRSVIGDLDQMLDAFKGWDPMYAAMRSLSVTRHAKPDTFDSLTKICSCFASVIKWKLCHHGELKSWIRVSLQFYVAVVYIFKRLWQFY